jgi:hypothetical protein
MQVHLVLVVSPVRGVRIVPGCTAPLGRLGRYGALGQVGERVRRRVVFAAGLILAVILPGWLL